MVLNSIKQFHLSPFSHVQENSVTNPSFSLSKTSPFGSNLSILKNSGRPFDAGYNPTNEKEPNIQSCLFSLLLFVLQSRKSTPHFLPSTIEFFSYFFCKVGQDQIGPCPFNGGQRFHHHLFPIHPSELRSCLD